MIRARMKKLCQAFLQKHFSSLLLETQEVAIEREKFSMCFYFTGCDFFIFLKEATLLNEM